MKTMKSIMLWKFNNLVVFENISIVNSTLA